MSLYFIIIDIAKKIFRTFQPSPNSPLSKKSFFCHKGEFVSSSRTYVRSLPDVSREPREMRKKKHMPSKKWRLYIIKFSLECIPFFFFLRKILIIAIPGSTVLSWEIFRWQQVLFSSPASCSFYFWRSSYCYSFSRVNECWRSEALLPIVFHLPGTSYYACIYV